MLSLNLNVPLVSVAILFAYIIYRSRRRSLGRLPPGPKGWPIVGNISDIPHENPWLTYTEWKKTYGDIVYLENFGSPTVILNSLDNVHEILDNRSAITSDRPRMVMANELMEWGWDFAHMPHTEYWRRHRKVFHQYFQQKNIPVHFPFIRKATTGLLNQLIQSPDNFRAHLRQFAGTVILKLTYDHEVKSESDYYVTLVDTALVDLLQVVHVGSNLVDTIPALKHIPTWFPGAHFKRKAQVSAKYVGNMLNVPFEQTKQQMAQGSVQPCFVSDNLAREGVDEEVVKNCAGIAYIAGSDTTVSMLATFFLAMVHYPEVQVRAQKEIDSVVGYSRLPDLGDRPSLPYIDAIISEIFRWNPPAPLALPHKSEEADVYEGYYLPAGSILIPNVWGIFHDEANFPEPDKFKPERFLEKTDIDPITMGGFGFGRRVCPGRHVALNSAWLAMAQTLAVFNISPKRDEKGKVRITPPKFVSGLIVHPAPFETNIIPRSSQALQLVKRAELEED